jgi:hypothetical protein
MHVGEKCPEADLSGERWESIFRTDTPIAILERGCAVAEQAVQSLLVNAPFARQGEGSVLKAVRQLGRLPDTLSRDIEGLAVRFGRMMGSNTVRIRLEGVTTDACRKLHTDYTDVRLITTYAGPGTEYRTTDDGELQRVPTTAIALVKGRLFPGGHPPCWHRSPPLNDTGERRIVLVIDTPDG